jgi:hypothetical protein
MRTLALAGAALLALAFPAVACDKYDQTLVIVRQTPEVMAGTVAVKIVPFDLLDEVLAIVEPLIEGYGYDASKATRAFVMEGPAMSIVGLEIGGCLLPPIRLMRRVDVQA